MQQETFDSTERTTTDFVLFALGFIGKVVAGAGVVVNSAATAVFGALLALFAVSSFFLKGSPDE
jgi:hypothetical protein